MGIIYYFFAVEHNKIFDVGKLSNFERFKPYLTSVYENWVLIHEDRYLNWFEIEPQDQKYTHEIRAADCNYNLELVIPKTVQKIDCFSEAFKSELQQWEEKQRELNEPITLTEAEWYKLTGAE